jgi:hypothetical protein
MKEIPARSHRLLGMLFLVGLPLIGIAVFFDSPVLGALAMTVFGGSACCIALADVRHLLTTRRGLGRLSGHISEERNPVSFKLHLILLGILACLWGTLFAYGFRALIS